MFKRLILALVIIGSVGCCRTGNGSDEKSDPLGLNNPKSTTPATTLTVDNPSNPLPTKAASGSNSFDRSVIKPIADHCSSAKVIMAEITTAVFETPGFHWRWADQVMLASPQFRVVPQASVPGEVSFQLFEHGPGHIALIATCAHGGTCNDMAAAYKHIVRSSNPQIFCGSVPGLGRSLGTRNVPSGSRADMPAANDIISQCARLAACQIRADPSIPGDPGLDCQKAPSNFKLSCASRASCAEVVACTGR